MQREPMNGAVLEGGGPRDFRAAQELSHDHTGKLFLTLIESLPQHVFFKGTNSVFISVNAAFAGDFGRKPEDFIGKSDLHLFPKELTEKYIADDQRIMANGRAETFEEVNRPCANS